jgi:hypothetical protein
MCGEKLEILSVEEYVGDGGKDGRILHLILEKQIMKM